MLSSPTQQCRIERGRVQVRRHRPSSTSEIQGERFWSEWITLATVPTLPSTPSRPGPVRPPGTAAVG